MTAMSAIATEQAQAEIAFAAARIGARLASQLVNQLHEKLNIQRNQLSLRLQEVRGYNGSLFHTPRLPPLSPPRRSSSR